MSSQAEQSSGVLGEEPASIQVRASIFSRSSIKAVLLSRTAEAAGRRGRGGLEHINTNKWVIKGT